MKISMRLIQSLNALWLYLIFILLCLGFIYEFFFLENVCSLCLLQRNLLMLSSMGFIFNLKYGVKLVHHLLSFFSALVGIGVSFYEHLEFLEVDLPNFSGGIVGIPLYSWSMLTFIILVVYLFVIMLARPIPEEHEKRKMSLAILIPIIGIGLISLINFLYYN